MALATRLVFFVFLLTGCSTVRELDSDMASHVKELERGLTLPAGASDISSYTRYYARTDAGMLSGVLVLGGDMGIHLVTLDKLPVVFDGGCSVIRIEYEYEARRVLSVSCSGLA
jgi:hypothetical protein